MQALLITGLGVLGLAIAAPQTAVISTFISAQAQNVVQPGPGEPRKSAAPRVPPTWAVALTTAALLAAAAWSVRPWPVLAATAWLVICGVPLGFIDTWTHRLPDVLTAAAYAGVMAFLIVAAAITSWWGSLGRAALGGAILAACYLAAAIARPGHVGLGDGKAAASAGSIMAWLSWQTLLAGTMAALLLGAACASVLLITRRASLRSRIPFGPALLGGALLAVMVAARASSHAP